MSNTPFSSSAEVFAWLSGFISLKGQTPKSFRLERMNIIASLAGHPEKCAPVIHVAGSKGKGSVTGMIASILGAAGLKTAQYVSPHVTEYRERITLGGAFLDESVYIEAGNELRELRDTLIKDAGDAYRIFDPACAEGEEPAYFELLTLYFFLCARLVQCDAMVVETGMGGRLDPTNIVDPLVSVITTIELEHTEFLGNTIGEIAGEKAGIIKPGRFCILGEQPEEAPEIFRKTAVEKRAPLFYFPEEGVIENLRVHRGGTGFSLAFTGRDFFPVPLDLSLSIPGAVQAGNAGLAVMALKKAFPFIGEDSIREGLKGFSLPARFERILNDPAVIIDGAHTPNSVGLCVDTFTSLYGEGGILLFGCAVGKNAEAMAALLLPHFSQTIITAPGIFKANEPEHLYRIFEAEGQRPGKPGNGGKTGTLVLIGETEKAIRYTLDMSREMGLPVLGIGSFYLAAAIRGYMQGPGIFSLSNDMQMAH
jgi:dihydrofolate synthase/folylpolyglutamate synthase